MPVPPAECCDCHHRHMPSVASSFCNRKTEPSGVYTVVVQYYDSLSSDLRLAALTKNHPPVGY
jgi:hypothetical protein